MEDRRELMRSCLELFHGGRIAEADRIATEAVRTFPDDGDLWQLHGLIRQRTGDHGGACAALETAGLLVPLNPAAQCALADCHTRAGRRELARDLFRNLAYSRSCPTALLPAVASGLGRLGEDATALDVCRELVRREPKRHEAHFGMAFYMRRMGHELETVLPAVARALELSPDSAVYRVLASSLLAQLGRFDEACELLRGVRPEAVGCAGCLRRVMAILDQGGADDVLEAFRAHADGAPAPCRDEPL